MKMESSSSAAEAVLSSSSSSSSSSAAVASVKVESETRGITTHSSSSYNCDNSHSLMPAIGGKKKDDDRVHINKEEDEEGIDEEGAEEEEEEGKDDNTNENYKLQATDDDDDDYAGWKVGDWCWLLPTTDNGNSTGCTTHSVKSEDGATNNNNNNNNNTNTTGKILCGKRTSSSRRRHHESNHDGNKKPPPKKQKTRLRSPPSHDTNNNNSSTSLDNNNNNNNNNNTDEDIINDDGTTIKSSSIQHEEDTNYDDDDNDDDNSTSSIINNSIDVNVSSNDEGCESWTVGNWCLLLSNVDKNEETEQQEILSSDEKANTKTASRRARTSSRRQFQNNERWNEMFQRLTAYKKQHNSTNVPRNYREDPQLGRWVNYQRRSYRNKTLSIERIHCLESIGFVWKMREILPWEEMYQRLVAYKNHNKTTNVPVKFQAEPQLGTWVSHQRNFYKKKKLSVDRIDHLESIGFIWDLRRTMDGNV